MDPSLENSLKYLRCLEENKVTKDTDTARQVADVAHLIVLCGILYIVAS